MIGGPLPGNTLWQGFGGACETTNDGDPTALFDPLAHRWLMSQRSVPSGVGGPVYQCIAVSTSADPTGTYYRYQFLTSTTKYEDYARFGVWPDGYYMSTIQYNYGLYYIGGGAYAFERAKMLTGDPTAALIYFDLSLTPQKLGGQLPSDFDGTNPPPAGAPNYFVEMDNAGVLLPTQDALGIWEFHADWSNPANSTFGLSGQPNMAFPISTFSKTWCDYPDHIGGCIEQPFIGGTMLMALGDRMMYRLQYRKYADHEALVANHTVDLGPLPSRGNTIAHAGIRWYELTKSGIGNWTIHQEGTYGPDDNSRWMGSIAADGQGNIALAYSISSEQIYPSIRYAGRLATDPLGEMAQGEVQLKAGSGYQNYFWNWGLLSMLAVDPQDDCTFWYTNEYYVISSDSWWHTRIGSFRFPSCAGAPAPPAAPSSLTAAYIATARRVDLQWSQLNKAGVVGYVVYRNQAYLTTVANPSTTTFTDTTVAVGAYYQYTVDAYDASGSHSPQSNPAIVQIPNSLTFVPFGDTYVDAAYPMTNFGASNTLIVQGTPDTSSLIAFAVQGWQYGAKATLRLYVTSTNSTGFAVRTGDCPLWSEYSINYAFWNTGGCSIPFATATSGPVTSGKWVSLDVTTAVMEMVGPYGNSGQVGLELDTTSTSAITMASRETGATAPQLILTAPPPIKSYLPIISR